VSRFAQPELERRWLMRAVPAAEPTRVVQVEDRYLPGPGLRLRAMSDTDGTTYKLTQKIPASTGGPGMITTIYLRAEQARSLHVLEAYVLRKTRMSFAPYGVDIFHDALAGLVLAEAEVVPSPDTPLAASSELLAAIPAPPGAVAEVTLDVTFTGGNLARMTSADLRAALTPYAL
jgi:FAD/FMN-containing dehydrogenase